MTNFTHHVGKKFNEDGSFRNYPGLTVISKIHESTIENNILKTCQQYFFDQSFSNKLAFLPHESFHTTIFELLNDQRRNIEIWSKKIALDTPMSDIDNFMIEAFKDIQKPEKIKMKLVGLKSDLKYDVLYISLEPYSKEQSQILKELRNLYSELSGLRKPNHDKYKYHITFAYKIIKFREKDNEAIYEKINFVNQKLLKELPTIELHSPKLHFYHDMSKFSLSIIR
ncbi:MAG: DUF1868 domain-containing protein [Clostridiales bacterium]